MGCGGGERWNRTARHSCDHVAGDAVWPAAVCARCHGPGRRRRPVLFRGAQVSQAVRAAGMRWKQRRGATDVQRPRAPSGVGVGGLPAGTGRAPPAAVGVRREKAPPSTLRRAGHHPSIPRSVPASRTWASPPLPGGGKNKIKKSQKRGKKIWEMMLPSRNKVKGKKKNECV